MERSQIGRELSELFTRVNEPLVVALDGAWGSGKSHFLKRWVGQHCGSFDEHSEIIYFDAFASDFLDDPLIALTFTIAQRLERKPQSFAAKAWQVAKNVAPQIGNLTLRLGTAAFVGAAVSMTNESDGAVNDVGDSVAQEAGASSKALYNFWNRENGKRAAIDAFKKAIEQLTEPDESGKPTKKLVIVIDELDRCRPDYALSILEIVKHFFNAKGVHFVLGVNLSELENSVKARYGSSISASRYLQKFITLKVELPNSTSALERNETAATYFRQVSKSLDISEWDVAQTVLNLIKILPFTELTLRDIERICTVIAISKSGDAMFDNGAFKIAHSCLVFVYALDQDLFKKIKSKVATFESIAHFFNLPVDPTEIEDPRLLYVWQVLAFSTDHKEPEAVEKNAIISSDSLYGSEQRYQLGPIAAQKFGMIDLNR
ncbi:MAG: KAP family P-loop NTPase fold protein [Cognatishimia sp.]|uniref:KAP family P-loop NTPase fold protein n=1 Tax=Cognatishimia sp. TaxID=2211648 RepID=UPI00405A2895